MIQQARAKPGNVDYLVADMRILPPRLRRCFDVVTCVNDSLNYLLVDTDFQQAIASMAAYLADGGLLLFDVNTLLTYQTIFSATQSFAVDGGVTFIWEGSTSRDFVAGGIAEASIRTVEAKEGERSSRHVQRHYPVADVVDHLSAAGLACLGAYGFDRGELFEQSDEAGTHKTIFVARRQ